MKIEEKIADIIGDSKDEICLKFAEQIVALFLNTKHNKIKAVLDRLANRKTWDDNDYFNREDLESYNHGLDDGETYLAQTLLLKFFRE